MTVTELKNKWGSEIKTGLLALDLVRDLDRTSPAWESAYAALAEFMEDARKVAMEG